MNNEEALNKFVCGLHPSIRGNVLAARPVDVDDACNIALAYASGLQLGYQNNYTSVPPLQQYQQQYQPQYQQQQYQYSGPEPMDLDAINNRRSNYQSCPPPRRTNATCHWCGDSGHFKRYCRDRLAAIKKLDEESLKKQGFCEAQPNEPTEHLSNKETFDQYKIVTNEEKKAISKENCDPCLTTNQHFLEDLHSAVDTDLSLYAATLHGQQILILIDSGASANYVLPWIKHLATKVSNIPGQSVETAGGHSIKINQKATLTLSLNGYTDSTAKPVPDWHRDNWSLYRDGQEFVLRPHGNRPMKPQLNYLISAKQVQKLSRREEAECFLLHIKTEKEVTNDEQWMKLVKEFDNVF
ncbi:CCHC-type zinc finger transcription factor [Phycomyces blakesleeanus NRRL 1555(-)]|uniref:CCHC-type zinc finger transcription factor n=1 Tax=Phycomyces blakesleeanus (strain ATCC 8743b / DSM 1359 / FGSC 10004 / NBRC 33097 / NRRL 1555) TaxID=763407 RepID=A0A167PJ86_PHYB8|nr:CCHC-type zinc finger transcription factor [Phycomyces blakesleeanus NRRL 1555(-)]OAD78056.1 CCHC-type zinc finger transcription factor [Phycomyces blakesleeanus NRRL 1555(-)]|eukprot:XP_018296096.1 CCHC-type zinc finger transcription factor [Phycomyces blakesleeanus NRRL 1555(-)]